MFYRSTRVFALLVGLMAPAIASRASAATLEEDYIASRDAAVAKLKAGMDRAQNEADRAARAKKEKAALAGLEKKMRAVIGPLQIPGKKAGTLRPATLYDHDGYSSSTLDGLMFEPADGRTYVVVTTDGLLQRWLNRDRGGRKKMPPTLREAASIDGFYSEAVSDEAAVMKYAVVPVETPAGATFVYAMLASSTQGNDVPDSADEVYLTLARAGKVFIASSALKTPIGPPAACEAIRRDFDKKAEDVHAAYDAGGAKDDALWKRYSDLREKGDKAFLSCFAELAAQQPSFEAAKKQAQDLLGRLPH